MDNSILSLPREVLDKIVRLLDLEDYVLLWFTSAKLRENLDPDSTVVEVGPLLLQLSKD